MAAGANGEEERSLRDDLAASLKEIEEREALETPTVPDDEGAQAPKADADAEPAEPNADRGDGRDAHGKFVKKDSEPQSGEEAQSEASGKPPVEAQDQQQEQAQASDTSDDQAPKSWRADEAKAWASVPPEAKAAILRREADAAKLAGHNDSERMFGREVAEVFRPHMEVINSFGVTPQVALKGLLDNDRILRFGSPEQKLAKAAQLVADYGIDLNALVNVQPQDPNVAALNAKIAQLEQRLTTPQQQQFSPLPPSVEEHNIQSEIEAFRQDPAHPHFDAVSQTMGKLLETGAAPDLESAYIAAVAMDPALRSTGIVPAATPGRKDPAAARQAAASVAPSPGPAGRTTPGTMRDELREGLRSAGFSV